MSPKFELRWLTRAGWDGPEKVLQYRYAFKTSDYGSVDPATGDFIKVRTWTEWADVPEVEDK